MCGISGYFSATKTIDGNLFANSHDLISHRGPDDEGYTCLKDNELIQFKGDMSIPFFDNLPHIHQAGKVNLCLAQKRLSILDLSENGHQPFISESEEVCMVFNGEIFNYIELRDKLQKKGVQFKTSGDTEVVLKSYLLLGVDCFKTFNGMWSIVLYDKRTKELIVSRDRFGIKPFFYSIQNEEFIFSSENKVVKKMMENRVTLNKDSVLKYLNRNRINDGETTFWNEIQELEPATILRYKGSTVSKTVFWRPEPNQRIKSFDDAINQVESLFEDSIKLRMRSDVGVGSLLSGGLDSSTIVCSLDKLGLMNDNFQAFSAVYENEQFSEKKYIEDTIKKINLRTNFVTPKAEELVDYMNKMLFHIETPFRSLSVYSQYKLYEKISQSSDIKVLLNGQGADEIFGGYSYHYYHIFADYLTQLRFKKFIHELKLLKKARGLSNFKVMKNMLIPFMNAAFKKDYFAHFNASELTTTPLREYLKYDDRTSMAFGIETRPPFLDYRLVEFALSLDNKFKIDEFENKKILRAYAKDVIPDSILNRKDKMGFVSPQEVWQRNELKSEFDTVFNGLDSNFYDFLDLNKIKKSYRDYQQGDHNNWTYIWRVYCLSKWKGLNG